MFNNEFSHHVHSQPDKSCLPFLLMMLGALATFVGAVVLAVSS